MRIRFVSHVAGVGSLTAVLLAVTPTRVAAQAIAEPTRLPVATPAQAPLTAAYDALNVPAMAAGSWYRDPTTGAKIYKLTSATFPTTGSTHWGHDYAEGGDEVSLPHTGTTRTILVYGSVGHWLIDFTPGGGVSTARPLTGTMAPRTDTAFTFSNNPATPSYAYVGNGNGIRRFDIRTMTEAPGDGWPVPSETGGAAWLHQSKNDELFVWMRGPTGSKGIVGYEPRTATKKVRTDSTVNEPRMDREGRYIGLGLEANGLKVWDWVNDTVSATWPRVGDTSQAPLYPFAHAASLRRRWIGVNWNARFPAPFYKLTSDAFDSGVTLTAPAAVGHGNGNWVQPSAALDDQWAIFYHYGALRPPPGDGELSPGGMVLMTANGQRRLLGHPYNTSSVYERFSFVKFSPDGAYVLFTSDMHGSGRSDVFLAELPTGNAP